MQERERHGTDAARGHAGEHGGASEEETADFDAAEFARATADEGGEAGLGGGGDDLGGGGDVAGDFGGLDEEGDEGKPV